MTDDTGVLCSICLGRDHTASSCPMRRTESARVDGIDRSKFRRNGTLVTKGLFLENYTPDRENVLYTFKKEDHGQYRSLYKLYMASEDLIEYDFANAYFESWEHWQSIVNALWMKEHISKWRSELEIKLKSLAVKEMVKEAMLGGKNAFQALKWIIDKGWIERTQIHGRGRPTKDEIRKAAMDAAFSDNQIQDDLKRLGIN